MTTINETILRNVMVRIERDAVSKDDPPTKSAVVLSNVEALAVRNVLALHLKHPNIEHDMKRLEEIVAKATFAESA